MIYSILKNVLALAGLDKRTIFARIKFWKYKSSRLYNPVANRQIHNIPEVFKLFSMLPKEIEFQAPGVALIHNRTFRCADLLLRELDKHDYLQLYTYHYLNFSLKNSQIPTGIIEDILDSKISEQPFIQSMQLFNILLDSRLVHKVGNDRIIEKYNSLYKSIEYHVDGNHVIENLISLVLTELKFNSKNFSTLSRLADELERQNVEGWHAERNVKYAKDLCIKLDILLTVISHYDIVEWNVNRLSDILDSWKSKLFENSRRVVLHDNIDGDDLQKAVSRYKVYSAYQELNKVQVHIAVPAKGVRGHAFDAKIAYPFSGLYKAFGTYTYASGPKRSYERLRSNNCQVYLDKRDFSHIFHLSFRSVLLLPYHIQSGNTYRIRELIVSKKSIVMLKYNVDVSDDMIVIRSNFDIKIDLFVDCDDFNDSRVQKTLGINTWSVTNSLRAVKINDLRRSKKITLEGSMIRIFI